MNQLHLRSASKNESGEWVFYPFAYVRQVGLGACFLSPMFMAPLAGREFPVIGAAVLLGGILAFGYVRKIRLSVRDQTIERSWLLFGKGFSIRRSLPPIRAVVLG